MGLWLLDLALAFGPWTWDSALAFDLVLPLALSALSWALGGVVPWPVLPLLQLAWLGFGLWLGLGVCFS
jgi:hypothetical protein